MNTRKNDFEKTVAQLDITPTMYNNAVEKYQAVSTYLEVKGISAHFYPQGSFRLGTVVRPYRNGIDVDYDLDVLCELELAKEKNTARHVKNVVGDALKENKTYTDILKNEDDHCWTLQYALVNENVGFELDIVPAVHQDFDSIQGLLNLGIHYDWAQKAIAITSRTPNGYNWQNSNPGGYADWFDTINAPFAMANRLSERNRIFVNNRNVYASIDEVPSQLERSSLQRVVQVLKRHRDVYYTANEHLWSLRSISAIITTLCAKIASHALPNSSTIDLLEFVVQNLSGFAELLQNRSPVQVLEQMRAYIERDQQKWRIVNPVDPKDNYAEYWDDATAKQFFLWVQTVQRDFLTGLTASDKDFLCGLKNGFGSALVESVIVPQRIPVPSVNISSGVKPYRR